jgi:hypothetical protein
MSVFATDFVPTSVRRTLLERSWSAREQRITDATRSRSTSNERAPHERDRAGS